MKLIKLFQDPNFLRTFHGYATIAWLVLIIPTLLFWRESVLWIALMSIWANVAGHWAAWQASRTETDG